MRDAVTTVIELAGFACIAAAGYTIGLTAGLFVTGLVCLAIGYLAGRR